MLVLAAPLVNVDDSGWADIASTATEALALLRQHRPTRVFIDFEKLACGTTGTHLARRVKAEDPTVSVFLLSRSVHPAVALWGQSCGAFAVMPRSRESIASCLSGWSHQVCGADDFGNPTSSSTLHAARRLVISSLLSLGRLNPDALQALDLAVEKLRADTGCRHKACATDMAHAIAERIGSSRQRSALLGWLDQVAPLHDRSAAQKIRPRFAPVRPVAGAMGEHAMRVA
ncbi:hypothetical protein ASC87_28615 [Rhizobacter sp. Root1221]|nr:hypothetical protein ASC87_28615 [Rhizobacter sp. Root1221]